MEEKEKMNNDESLNEVVENTNNNLVNEVENQPETENSIESENGQAVVEGEVVSEKPSSEEEERKRKKEKTKKIIRWVGYGFAIACLVFLLSIVITLCVEKYQKKSPAPSVFGISMLIVKTESMQGTFDAGDVLVIKQKSEYKIGDIITFIHEGETTPTTHRIVRQDGEIFYTKGDNNNAEDPETITKENIIGYVSTVIPDLGLFIWWLRDELGWIYIVGAILIIVVGVYVIKYFLPKNKETEK